ncbi:MAG: hypothetical protein KDA85_12065, partial [Planctomycetaceae bacterium]|nr:hypothetical protein [Planctomycetaceae bacterium]
SWWEAEQPCCLHSAEWWRRHWQRSGVLDVMIADTLPNGWQFWRDWVRLLAPENATEIEMLEVDAGRNLGYLRAIGRRRNEVPLFDPAMSIPPHYTPAPMLRSPAD